MKKIFSLLLVMISLGASAQILQPATGFGQEFNRIRAKYQLGIPDSLYPLTTAEKLYPHLGMRNDTMFLWNPATQAWKVLSAGPADRDIDVFIIGGQSNAEGSGDSALSPTPAFGTTFQYYKGIRVGKDPIGTSTYGSAWPSFAVAYYNLTGRRVCFVPTAVGGSAQTKASAWYSPDGAHPAPVNHWDTAGGINFPASIDSFRRAVVALKALGFNPVLKGVLWNQGEADGRGIQQGLIDSAKYGTAMRLMINRYRDSLGVTMPFYIYRSGYYLAAREAAMKQIRAVQDNVGSGKGGSNPLTSMVFYNTIDFNARGYSSPDSVHYNQAGLNEMGTMSAMNIVGANSFLWQRQGDGIYVEKYNAGFGTRNPLAPVHIKDTVLGSNPWPLVMMKNELDSNLMDIRNVPFFRSGVYGVSMYLGAFSGQYSTATGGLNGANNTAVGYEAMRFGTTGGFNTAVGYNALRANVTGAFNTVIGERTLRLHTNGDNNVAVGQRGMSDMTSGSNNTAVGTNAGDNISTGSSNIFLGFEANINGGSGSGKIVIGTSGAANVNLPSNSFWLGNGNSNPFLYGLANGTDRKMAMGTLTPSAFFTIRKDGIGPSAPTDTTGILLENLSPASSSTESSPALVFSGQAYKSNSPAASQPVKFKFDLSPESGATTVAGSMRVAASINGGAYADKFSFNSAGTFRQTAVTSAMLKANSNGDLVAAVAGTDYYSSASAPTLQNVLDAGNYAVGTPVSLKLGGPNSSNPAVFLNAGSTSGSITIQTFTGSTLQTQGSIAGNSLFFNRYLGSLNYRGQNLVQEVTGTGVGVVYDTLPNAPGVLTVSATLNGNTIAADKQGNLALGNLQAALSGTTGYLPYYTSSTALSGTSPFYTNGTNGGVGTTSVSSYKWNVVTSGSAGMRVQVSGSTLASPALDFLDASSGVEGIISSQSSRFAIGTYSNHPVAIHVNNNSTPVAAFGSGGSITLGGTTPKAWASQTGTIEGGGANIFMGVSSDMWLSSNAYYGSGEWTRIASGKAANIGVYDGEIWTRVAGSGSGAVTFINPFKATVLSGQGTVAMGGNISTTSGSISGASAIVGGTFAQFEVQTSFNQAAIFNGVSQFIGSADFYSVMNLSGASGDQNDVLISTSGSPNVWQNPGDLKVRLQRIKLTTGDFYMDNTIGGGVYYFRPGDTSDSYNLFFPDDDGQNQGLTIKLIIPAGDGQRVNIASGKIFDKSLNEVTGLVLPPGTYQFTMVGTAFYEF